MRPLVCCSVIAMLGLALACARQLSAETAAHYVGSASCERCHAQVYAGWKQTRMANVVRDPKTHPEAVLADFTHAESAGDLQLE